MNKPRIIVDVMTEFVLAVVLVSILGGSYWLGLKLNPIQTEQQTVLGTETARTPWEFFTVNSASQKSLIANDNGFTVVYDLASDASQPLAYELFTLNNFNKAPEKYRMQANLDTKDAGLYKLVVTLDGKEHTIFDAKGDNKYQDIDITIPKNRSIIPAFKLISYEKTLKNVAVEFSVAKI